MSWADAGSAAGADDEDVEGESHGLAPAPGTNIIDTALLKTLDQQFEDEEREAGISESWIAESRDFCFLCVYGDRGQIGGEAETRRVLGAIRQFRQMIRETLSMYSLTHSCIRIKEYYEGNVRPFFLSEKKLTFTHANIAKHILEHDASVDSVMAMDVHTHALVMNKLRCELVTSDGAISQAALSLYLKTSSNFNRFYGAAARNKGQGSGT
jgi:hypothetical protein